MNQKGAATHFNEIFTVTRKTCSRDRLLAAHSESRCWRDGIEVPLGLIVRLEQQQRAEAAGRVVEALGRVFA